MSSDKYAFPKGDNNSTPYGLTKREYIATHLMQGLRTRSSESSSALAAIAVRDTDALIATLKETDK